MLFAEGFVVEAEVEVGVAELVAEAVAGGVLFGGGEDVYSGAFTGEEVVDFLHGDSGVAGDGDEFLAGLFDGAVFGADDAEEVPGGVFDVVAVDLLVGFELGDTFFVFAGVVEGESTLPVVGGAEWDEGDFAVPVGDGFGNAGGVEVFDAAFVEGGGVSLDVLGVCGEGEEEGGEE